MTIYKPPNHIFRSGQKIRLLADIVDKPAPSTPQIYALKDATAIVDDPPYTMMSGTGRIYLNVTWVRDALARQQCDGAYHEHAFELDNEQLVSVAPEKSSSIMDITREMFSGR